MNLILQSSRQRRSHHSLFRLFSVATARNSRSSGHCYFCLPLLPPSNHQHVLVGPPFFRCFSSSPTDRSRKLTEIKNGDKKQAASSSSSSSFDRTTVLHGMQQTVYVHPLSQIILEYLQDCRHDWIVHHGLDQSLTVHRDGSFVLKFASSGRSAKQEHDSEGATVAENKIWTSYDEQAKKHWLTVHKQSLHQRFLLQDNTLPAWHGNRKSLPERIHLSIESMIRAVDRLDMREQRQQQ